MKGWNTMSEKGTSLAQYVEHFGLEILNHGDTYETDKVESTNVNRPDLQILGLFDYFDARRIQVMGKAELTYIMKMSENRRTKVFDDLFSYTIPALVLARIWNVPQSACNAPETTDGRCCGQPSGLRTSPAIPWNISASSWLPASPGTAFCWTFTAKAL